MRTLLLLICALALWSEDREAIKRRVAAPPPSASLDHPLTVDEAVAIALWNNKQLDVDLAALGFAEADLTDAKLLRNPMLQLLFPTGPKRFELFLTMPIELLWQRPRRIAFSESNLKQLSELLVQNGLNLARDVRLAHSNLLLVSDRIRIATGNTALRERIAEMSERRLRAGDISRLELQALRIDAVAAADLRDQFLDARKPAEERLRGLLGFPRSHEELTLAPFEPPAAPSSGAPQRPDLMAAKLAIERAEHRLHWERSRWASLAPGLSTKGSGQNPVYSGPAVAGEAPIFNRNQGGIANARAELARAQVAFAALQDQVDNEVRSAEAQLLQATQALDRIRKQVLPTLREAVELAEKGFVNGDLSRLNVIEAQRPLFDAQLREAEALDMQRRAWAEYQRSIGK